MFRICLFVSIYSRLKKKGMTCKLKKALLGQPVLAVLPFIVACSVHNENTFNIIKFGAVSDGSTLNTKSIQMAINKAVSSKGTVIVPKGKFYTGSLILGPNMTFQLEDGAELIASSRMEDYNGSNFIFAPEAHNLKIQGKGTINGNGKSFFDEDWKYNQRPQPWIRFQDAKNISVSGITLVNCPSHCLVFSFCEDVKVDRINITNDPRSPNTDGIDVVNSKNVQITNCRIATGDDAICVKNKGGAKYFEDLSKNRSRYTENITVRNCILESDDAALKLGTGSAYHTRNCTFQDITIKNSRYGIALFMMDGGKYSDINFQNINITTGGRHKDEYGIFVDTHRRDSISEIGNISNIHFKDLDITTNGLLYFSGYPTKEIEGISLENIKITIPKAYNTIARGWKKPKGNKKIRYWKNTLSYMQSPASMIVAHAKNIKIKDLTIIHQLGEMDRYGFYLIDVEGLDTVNLKGNPLNKDQLIFSKNKIK